MPAGAQYPLPHEHSEAHFIRSLHTIHHQWASKHSKVTRPRVIKAAIAFVKVRIGWIDDTVLAVTAIDQGEIASELLVSKGIVTMGKGTALDVDLVHESCIVDGSHREVKCSIIHYYSSVDSACGFRHQRAAVCRTARTD